MIQPISILTTQVTGIESPDDSRRARFVVGKIDEILTWQDRVNCEREVRFVTLGWYLCEVRERQYWRIEKMGSFSEFLEKRFPGSRRKAYYLMAIHEHLPPEIRKRLKRIGCSKAVELVRVARADAQTFDSAIWLHKAEILPKREFSQQVERHLTGKVSEPSDIIYFKVYKNQLGTIERALETAELLLGPDKPRGAYLEMICADFMAGAKLFPEAETPLCLPDPTDSRTSEEIGNENT